MEIWPLSSSDEVRLIVFNRRASPQGRLAPDITLNSAPTSPKTELVCGRDRNRPHGSDDYELLMEIDPTNYKIAVSQAEASVQSAQSNVQNTDAQMDVQQAQISNSPRLQRCPQEKRSGLLQYPGSHWNRARLASRARGCGFWLLFVACCSSVHGNFP